jgi:hypothetical protein
MLTITKKRRAIVAVGALIATAGTAMVTTSGASAIQLTGSEFEIDDDANLILNANNPGTIDWATVNEVRQADKPTGAGDDSFGQGAKEDT